MDLAEIVLFLDRHISHRSPFIVMAHGRGPAATLAWVNLLSEVAERFYGVHTVSESQENGDFIVYFEENFGRHG